MRFFTIFLQVICVALGILFVGIDFVRSGKLDIGGVVFGSMMLFFAASLGADHTTNSSSNSRRVFKGFILLFACPIILAGILGCYELLVAGRWLDAIRSALRCLFFVIVIFCIAFDHHPIIRRAMTKFGISTPKN